MKTIIFTFALLLLCFAVNAQQSDTIDAYKSRAKEGFIFCLNQKLPINGQYGISIGVSGEYRLTKIMYLQPQIIISYLPRNVSDKRELSRVLEISYSFLFKPFDLKNNPTISIGTNYKFYIKNIAARFFGDVAFGIERKFKHYAIVPQLRLSYGQTMQILYMAIILKK